MNEAAKLEENSSERQLRPRVYIEVGGRFHSDHMAESLIGHGFDILILTSLPAGRFPKLDRKQVQAFVIPEIVFRLLMMCGLENQGDLIKMEWLGRLMAKRLKRLPAASVLLGWSSFSLESFQTKLAKKNVLIRDSSHIDFQTDLLVKEYDRLKLAYPERSMCQVRERQEYEIADSIIVPSEYAKRTFIDKGFSENKIRVLPLAVDTSQFRPKPRAKRNGPLKVINFGYQSIRKGTPYLLEATKAFSPDQVQFHIVGSIQPELKALMKEYPNVHWHRPMNHGELSRFLNYMDVFVFPTLEDGYGQVVPQAMAVGLACVVSENSGASSLIENDKNGLLIRPGTESIVRAINRLIEEPALAQELGSRATQSSLSITWESYGNLLASFVEGLVVD